MRRRALTSFLGILVLAGAGTASAAWSPPGEGSGAARAKQMPSGNQPTASVSNRSVTASWTASTFNAGGNVDGYVVKRYNGNDQVQTIGSGCSGTVAGLSCTEQAVPAGTWKYTVTPKHGNWTGPESAKSGAVTVAAPNFSFTSSTTVSSLPTTLNGDLANFISGQSVTFRLDDPNSGTVLSGSISPNPVPGSGSASVTVTIPAGTANGSHTVYAVGNQGDVASATVTVDVDSARRIPSGERTTAAWDLRDASSGTESNQSALTAFADDGRTRILGPWPSSFSATRHAEFDMNSPLPSGLGVSSAAFRFRFAPRANGTSACFYLEVRRRSTDALVATHGSASNPLACNSTTTLQTVTTSIPSVADTALANDLRIRVYVRESGTNDITVDEAVVTGSSPYAGFTLYAATTRDSSASSGSVTILPWSLAADDGTTYTTSNWLNLFDTTRYLDLRFPGYLPSDAVVTEARFRHRWRPGSGVHEFCNYLEVYSGSSLIATKGSAASPLSCATGSAFVTDTVSLPEVDTAAEANQLRIRFFGRSAASTGARTSIHDLTLLDVKYHLP